MKKSAIIVVIISLLIYGNSLWWRWSVSLREENPPFGRGLNMTRTKYGPRAHVHWYCGHRWYTCGSTLESFLDSSPNIPNFLNPNHVLNKQVSPEWTVLVLIPKGTTNTRGISLLETLCKVVEALIDNRIQASLQMHDVLHRLRAIGGTGAVIMKLNFDQDIVSIDQSPLSLVILDLRKANENVDREYLLITLEGYSVGPCLCGILETFWDLQQLVPRQNVFHGPAFPAKRGTTQGGLVSPTLLNVVVDDIIRTWLAMTVEDQRVDHDGLGKTDGRCMSVFYSNDGMVDSWEPDWLQHLMNILVGLFQKYDLVANVSNSCTMTFQPGILRLGMLVEAKPLKCTGVRYSYWVRIRRRILCLECGVELTMGSMMAHRQHMHRTEPAIDWIRLPVIQTEHLPQVYVVSFPQSTKRLPCPFPGCLVSSHMWNGLRSHFIIQHWGDRIRNLEEHPNPLPSCKHYGS